MLIHIGRFLRIKVLLHKGYRTVGVPAIGAIAPYNRE